MKWTVRNSRNGRRKIFDCFPQNAVRYYWRASKQVYGARWNQLIDAIQEALDRLRVRQSHGVGVFPTTRSGRVMAHGDYLRLWKIMRRAVRPMIPRSAD